MANVSRSGRKFALVDSGRYEMENNSLGNLVWRSFAWLASSEPRGTGFTSVGLELFTACQVLAYRRPTEQNQNVGAWTSGF